MRREGCLASAVVAECRFASDMMKRVDIERSNNTARILMLDKDEGHI